MAQHTKGLLMSEEPMICRHCNRRKVSKPRQLCYRCHLTPGIRCLYPTDATMRPDLIAGRPKTETEADLDRLIAHQRRQLPAWWREESAKCSS